MYTPGTATFLRIQCVPIWLDFYVFVGWKTLRIFGVEAGGILVAENLGYRYVNADFLAADGLTPFILESNRTDYNL